MCLYMSTTDDDSTLSDGINVTFNTVKPFMEYDPDDEEALKY